MRVARPVHRVVVVPAYLLIIGSALAGSVTISHAADRSPLLPGQPVNEHGQPVNPGRFMVYDNGNVNACYRYIDGRTRADYYGRDTLYLANDRRVTSRTGRRSLTVSAKIYDFETVINRRLMIECDSAIDTYAGVQVVRRTSGGVRRYGSSAVMRGDDNPFYDGEDEGETKRRVTLKLPSPLTAADRRSGRYGVRFTIYGKPRISNTPNGEPDMYGYLGQLPAPVKKALPVLWIR